MIPNPPVSIAQTMVLRTKIVQRTGDLVPVVIRWAKFAIDTRPPKLYNDDLTLRAYADVHADGDGYIRFTDGCRTQTVQYRMGILSELGDRMKKVRIGNRKGLVASLAVLIFVNMMICNVTVAASGWTINRLTNNDYDDRDPGISGTNVVWSGWDGSDWEVYSNYAGAMTNNSRDDMAPAISGTNVVWQRWAGSDWEIFSNFAGRLTDNARDDTNPAISGNNVVWERWDGSDYEIFSNFDGRLTNNGRDDQDPAISGTNVVWAHHDGSDWEIASNFAGRLTDNGGDDHAPRHFRRERRMGALGCLRRRALQQFRRTPDLQRQGRRQPLHRRHRGGVGSLALRR